MELKKKREAWAKLLADARAINDAAGKEQRSMTADETAQFDRMMDDADQLEAEIRQLERLEAAEQRGRESAGRQTNAAEPGSTTQTDSTPVNRRAKPEYRQMVATYLRGGFSALGPQESRALQADSDILGGYLVASEQMSNELIKAIDAVLVIRQLATREVVASAKSLGVPTLEADPADADWTSELLTGNEDSSMSFGKRELHPHPLAKLIKLSVKLLQSSSRPAEAMVLDRLAYKFAVAQEKAFMTGTGSGQPLGLFTASANGVSTGRDVATDNQATAVTADGLINAKYSLREVYLADPSLRWVFHRDAVKQIRKLKDGNGQYLWQAGLLAGAPNTLLDVPIAMSEYCPNTFTSGSYVGLIGALRYYLIADAADLQIQRLNELYARTNQVGFLGRLESDGQPILEEAFVRVKLG